MKSLNEKLAEVCGKEVYTNSQGVLQEYNPMMGNNTPIWNPTTDLNQLRECYMAADKDDPDFQSRFYVELCFGLATVANTTKHLATAWVKHPELVAKAILKAKGVE